MGLMNKVKSAVKGRSAQIEKGVDTAVKKVDEKTSGKYSDKLAKGADAVKNAARKADSETTGSPADPKSAGTMDTDPDPKPPTA